MFEIRCCGIPCQLDVTWYEPYIPATFNDPPEGGEIEFDLYDRKGYRAEWLERKADNTPGEMERLTDIAWKCAEDDYEEGKAEAEISRHEAYLESQGIYR